MRSIKKNTDANKANAKNVEIYDSVTEIDDRAFFSCESLTSITLGNSVTRIGSNSFHYCIGLTSITIPASITSIHMYAFVNCSNLASVTMLNSSKKLSIGNTAFEGISYSAKLYVPSNLLSEYQADSKWTGAFKGGIFAIQ